MDDDGIVSRENMAMSDIAEILEPLSEDACDRVLRWVVAVYAPHLKQAADALAEIDRIVRRSTA